MRYVFERFMTYDFVNSGYLFIKRVIKINK